MNDFVVFNPGSHPAIAWIGRGLAEKGSLAAYHTGLQLSEREASSVAKLGLAGRLTSRTLPEGLRGPAVKRGALSADLLAAKAKRSGKVVEERRWLTKRNARIGTRAMESLRGRGQSAGLLMPTNTLTGLHAALSVDTSLALYTPLPYLPFLQRLMDEESIKNPQWSKFLQFRSTDQVAADPQAIGEAARAQTLIANSTFSALSFPPGGARVISAPLAVPLSLLRRSEHEPPSASRTRLRLLFAGQVNQRKGLSYLFDALRRLSASSIELIVVGSDPLRMFDALTKAFPEVRAAYLGALDQRNLWAQMQMSDALIFPSLAEGYGNVINEALALGLPVIATSSTGAVDAGVNRKAGFVVPPASANDLAEAIDAFASDASLRAQYQGAAVELARSIGGWDVYGARVSGHLVPTWGTSSTSESELSR